MKGNHNGNTLYNSFLVSTLILVQKRWDTMVDALQVTLFVRIGHIRAMSIL